MISSNVNVFDRFDEVTEEVEQLARTGLDRAARAGAREAERIAAEGLKQHARMEVITATGTPDGYAAGFRSTAKGKNGQPIARFHDQGTYGNRKARKGSAAPRRKPRAQNVQDVNPETGEPTGIKALGFFGAGRRVGRRELLRTIDSAL